MHVYVVTDLEVVLLEVLAVGRLEQPARHHVRAADRLDLLQAAELRLRQQL